MKYSSTDSASLIKIKKELTDQLYGWTRYVDRNYLDEILTFLISNYPVDHYGTNPDLCPNLKDVFEPFNICSPWNLKAIIVGGEPKPSIVETFKIPFGQEGYKSRLSTSLRMFQRSIDSTIDEKDTSNSTGKIDQTLKDWIQQGILIINSSPTVLWDEPGSHADLWYPLMRDFFTNISTELHDIPFVFLGANASRYIDFIAKDRGHLVILDKLPSHYSDNGVSYVYNFFKNIDDFLMENFKEVIHWNERIDKTVGSSRNNYDANFDIYD